MVVAFITVGGGVGGLIALAALMTLGLGPIMTLLVFWIGGLAATLALAVIVARSTSVVPAQDDVQGSASTNGEAP